jgi:hypothetical protein
MKRKKKDRSDGTEISGKFQETNQVDGLTRTIQISQQTNVRTLPNTHEKSDEGRNENRMKTRKYQKYDDRDQVHATIGQEDEARMT